MKKFWKGLLEKLFGVDMRLSDDAMYWTVLVKERRI